MSVDKQPWFRNWPKDVPQHINFPKIPLHGFLDEAAKRHPENPALIYFNKEIKYSELKSLSDRFAAALMHLGVEKGDRVALFLPNIPQFVVAYYGALKAGAVFTAISPLHREREVEYQLTDSGAKIVVTLDSLLPMVETVWQKTCLQNVIITNSGDFTNQQTYGEAAKQRFNSYSFMQLLNKERKLPYVQINPAVDLAGLQYTGGTTGKAKAAMLTHSNLVSNAFTFAAWIRGVESKETFLAGLPFFHIYGMTTSLNVPISLASKVVLLPKFEPGRALEAIERHKVTIFCGVPTMYQTLVASSELGKYDLTSIRVCISGASPLPPQVQKKFMQITGGLLAEGYGLTEASPVTHCTPVDATEQTLRVGSIGLPLPETDAKIVDAENVTRRLGTGMTGELVVRGPQVMKGYWHHPEETALVLRDGWLFTGDIGRMDENGYFYITDRKKDLIKYKDYSVYPREIEDVLYEHPAVKICAVVGVPDVNAGEIPKAFVVLVEGVSASEKEIAEFVNARVAPYKAVRLVEFRKDLPLSSAGKVLRVNLKFEARADQIVKSRQNL